MPVMPRFLFARMLPGGGFAVILILAALNNLSATASDENRGGDGGRGLTVTSLADDGPGTLREALAAKGPRVIRFALGGEIWLKSPLSIREPFVTVDGESAPSPGLSILGDRVKIRSHDVILRHVRIRVGALLTASDPQSRDGLQILSSGDGKRPSYRILVENCSVSWAVDENVELWGGNIHDVTIRRCLIAEGLVHSIHPKGGTHSAGLIIGPGASRVLVERNLFASNAFRNPVVTAGAQCWLVNNVIANPGFGGIHFYGREGEGGVKASLIGNVIIAGPDSRPSLGFFHEKGLNAGSAIYLADNRAVGLTAFDRASRPSNWSGDASPFVPEPPVPLPAGTKVLPADQVEETVLAEVGARPWDRDAVDRRLIAEVRARGGSLKDFPTDTRLCPEALPELTGPLATYARLLKTYVTPKGVRYAAWKANAEDMASLEAVAAQLGDGPGKSAADWINAYNARLLHEVLAAYPQTPAANSPQSFFGGKRIPFAGQTTSFEAIARELHDRFKDFRIVFALYRPGRGGPSVAGEPYLADRLAAQLDRQAGRFINDPRHVSVKDGQVRVTPLLEWNAALFPEGVRAAINRFRQHKIPDEVPIVYEAYDATLDEVRD